SFQASYGGDSVFGGSTADCEPLTVTKADTSTATQIHDGDHQVVTSVPLGTAVHDSATVTSANTSFKPTGTVSFTFYGNGECSGDGVAAGSAPLDGEGVADGSSVTSALAAGSYSFRAHYGGDSNFNASEGPCEPLTVTKADTSTATEVHDGDHQVVTSVPLGSTVHDSATVTSANDSFDPTGTVSFTWYANGECSGEGSAAGSASLRAHYGGDSNFNASEGPCEPLTVTKADTSTATEVHDGDHQVVTSVPLGSTVHDSATVTSANDSFDPTGTVSFTWYANGECSGEGSSAGTASLDGGVAHPSSSEGPLAAGSYS